MSWICCNKTYTSKKGLKRHRKSKTHSVFIATEEIKKVIQKKNDIIQKIKDAGATITARIMRDEPDVKLQEQQTMNQWRKSKKRMNDRNILTTEGLPREFLKDFYRQTKGAEKPILLEVVPNIGFISRCHLNAKKLVAVMGDEWERRLGWNILGNEIGAIGEIHAVSYHKPTDTYVDITPDFNGETKKWFMPLPNYKYYDENNFWGRKYDNITLRTNYPPKYKGYDVQHFNTFPTIEDFNNRFGGCGNVIFL